MVTTQPKLAQQLVRTAHDWNLCYFRLKLDLLENVQTFGWWKLRSSTSLTLSIKWKDRGPAFTNLVSYDPSGTPWAGLTNEWCVWHVDLPSPDRKLAKGRVPKSKKCESMVFDHRGGAGGSAETRSLFRFEDRFLTLNIASSSHDLWRNGRLGLFS